MGSKRGRITALEEYMEFNGLLPWGNYLLSAPSKECSKCLWVVYCHPGSLSQTTELELGNGVATGIQLVARVRESREDNWVILWHAGTVVYRGLLQPSPSSHFLDDRSCVSTHSFTLDLLPTLPSACLATASYCNGWPLPGLCLLVFAMYLGRVMFHTWQKGSSSAEELISSHTGNFVASSELNEDFHD